jgi:hypothetical protein
VQPAQHELVQSAVRRRELHQRRAQLRLVRPLLVALRSAKHNLRIVSDQGLARRQNTVDKSQTFAAYV